VWTVLNIKMSEIIHKSPMSNKPPKKKRDNVTAGSNWFDIAVLSHGMVWMKYKVFLARIN